MNFRLELLLRNSLPHSEITHDLIVLKFLGVLDIVSIGRTAKLVV